jgi:hypothetical protein
MNYLTYHESGARASAWAALAYAIYCSVVTVVALLLKNKSGATKTDGVCVALAIASGGVMWWTTPLCGQVVSVLAEVIGYVPILRDHREEDPVAWSLDFGSNVVNMAAVTALTFGLLLYPTVIMVCNGVVVWLVMRQRYRLRRNVASTNLALAASPQ